MQRLGFALLVSAGAHVAVLANAPLAPGMGQATLFSGQPLTAHIASAPAVPQMPELPPRSEPASSPAPVTPPATALAQAAGLPSAEIYFRGSELDERAMPLGDVNLVYPEQALAAGQAGVVTLRLKIDHMGVLREATIVDAKPLWIFEDAALEAVRELRFRPAVRNGVPVGSIKIIEVPFHPDCTLTGSCISGAGVQAAPVRR